MKLSAPREIEIVASSLAPAASANCFSFTVAGDDPGQSNQQNKSAWERRLESERTSLTRDETTYHAASLEVWTHAGNRSQAVRQILESTKSNHGMAKAIKAASSGRRLGRRLEDHASRGGPLLMPETDIET